MTEPRIPPMEYVSDYIVEILDAFGIDVVAFNPGASFRGIHDSLAQRDRPQVVLCTQEMVAVAVAHGYARAAHRPMAVPVHNIVGLQQASMAIFNAWCDRVPVLLIGGCGPLSIPDRRPWIDWIHTAQSQGQLVRDYVKWDDQPVNLESIPESFVRAWTTMMSAPSGPVYLCYDTALQEAELPDPVPAHPSPNSVPVPDDPAPPQAVVDELAARLAASERPVLVTDFAGDTLEGYDLLQQIAEAFEVPVIDCGRRHSFPAQHRLSFAMDPAILAEADAVIALDVDDLFGALHEHVLVPGDAGLTRRDGCWIAHVTPQHLRLRAWASDGQRQVPCDLVATGTATAALRALQSVLKAVPASPEMLASRRQWMCDRPLHRRARWRDEAASESAPGTVSNARVALEMDKFVRRLDDLGRPWVLGHGTLDGWERRLWPLDRFDQRLCPMGGGGGGLGFGVGATIGVSLAVGRDTTVINLQPDGDLLFTPSALWTVAHHDLPILTVVLNNRQYGNTAAHALTMAAARNRPVERFRVGNEIDLPAIDYAALAESMGIWSCGPIDTPDALDEALNAAGEVVAAGHPALIEVLTPPVGPG